MFQLRPYQNEAKNAILAEWDAGRRKTLLVLPTGTGKTCVFSAVTAHQVERGHRVLVMAHRGELLAQAADKLKEASGLDASFEQGESHSLGSFLPVTVGSVQSLCQEKRLAEFPQDYFQDIIVDEAQGLTSPSSGWATATAILTRVSTRTSTGQSRRGFKLAFTTTATRWTHTP